MIGKGLESLASILGLSSMLSSDSVPSDNVNPIMTQESEREAPPVPEDSAILKLEDVADDTDVFDDDSKNIMFNDVIERLGVKPDDQAKAYRNLEKFAELTRNTESSNNYKAENIPVGKNKKTSAKGAYQFVDGSIVPALNRLKRLINEQTWMTDLRKSKDIFSLTDKQQDLLFFGDIFEKRVDKTKGVGDKLLKKIVKGDRNAMLQMYEKAHHTGVLPPEAKKNAQRKFLQEDNNKKQGGSIVERNPYNYQPKAI